MLSIVTPAWSPRGDRIAVVVRRRSPAVVESIALVDATSGASEDLRPPEWDRITGLGWEPGGEALLVTAEEPDADDRSQIWSLGADDRTTKRLSNDLSTYAGLSLAPNGTRMLSLQIDRRTTLRSVVREGDQARWWTADAERFEALRDVRRAPAGGTFVLTRREGRGSISRIPAPGEPRQPLTAPGTDVVGFDVSADGATVIYEAGSGGAGVHRVTVATGVTTRLGDPGTSLRGVCGASALVLLEGRPGLWELAEGDDPRRVGSWLPYSSAVACSPDGELLAFDVGHDPDTPGEFRRSLVVVSRRDGRLVRSLAWPDGRNLRFTPEGDAVAYLVGAADQWELPVAGGDPAVRRTHAGGILRAFDFSEDGREIVGLFERIRSDAVLIARSLP